MTGITPRPTCKFLYSLFSLQIFITDSSMNLRSFGPQVGGGYGLAPSDEGTVVIVLANHEILHGVRHGSFETMGFHRSLVRTLPLTVEPMKDHLSFSKLHRGSSVGSICPLFLVGLCGIST